MKYHEILEANKRLSNFIITSDKDKGFQEDLERRYPHKVQLNRYYGDWGLGASETSIRFSHDTLNEYEEVEVIFTRWSNVNNPLGNSPGIIEGIYVDTVEKRQIRELRDFLNGLLGEGNS